MQGDHGKGVGTETGFATQDQARGRSFVWAGGPETGTVLGAEWTPFINKLTFAVNTKGTWQVGQVPLI